MIATKSIYKDKKEKSDGTRILVTRYWARGKTKAKDVSDWYRDLAPSKELHRDWYDGKLTEAAYTKRYLEEMNAPPSREKIKELATQSGQGETVTLLCVEPEGEFCHRHLLKNLIEKESA